MKLFLQDIKFLQESCKKKCLQESCKKNSSKILIKSRKKIILQFFLQNLTRFYLLQEKLISSVWFASRYVQD